MLRLLPKSSDRGRPHAFVLSFALRVAIVLAVTSAGIVWFVRMDATHRAERAVGFHARFVANTILRDRLLSHGDISLPPRAEIDRLIRREVLVEGAVAATINDRAGRMSY